jgi:hypothetical protein
VQSLGEVDRVGCFASKAKINIFLNFSKYSGPEEACRAREEKDFQKHRF